MKKKVISVAIAREFMRSFEVEIKYFTLIRECAFKLKRKAATGFN